jgi:putative colanic acid biosynthesis UDP-glucose lipid carrier transferase
VLLYLYLEDNDHLLVVKDTIILLVISILCWYFSAKLFSVYQDMRTMLFSGELITLVKVILFHSLLFSFCFLILFPYYPYQRTFVTLYPVLATLLLMGERYWVRKTVKRLRLSGRYSKKVLIVGAGVRGMHFYETVVKKQQNGYRLAGFVDDEVKEYLNGEYLGTLRDLDRILKTTEVDDVVIALPTSEAEMIVSTIKVCERNARRVKVLPNYGILGLKIYTANYDSVPVVDVRSYPLDDFESRLAKRAFDILFASVAMIFLLSWLFPIIALLIKLESSGPVFFKQLRTGLNNKDFLCWKFRSMRVNDAADQLSATRHDERVTRLGRFLRKTSLDELPQFFNVFMGNMSVVGPRPHMVKQNQSFSDIVNEYMLRHFVKPGITGLAQVNGYRGEVTREDDIRKRVECDIWYIENWKFGLDIQIILQTMINIVKGDDKAF